MRVDLRNLTFRNSLLPCQSTTSTWHQTTVQERSYQVGTCCLKQKEDKKFDNLGVTDRQKDGSRIKNRLDRNPRTSPTVRLLPWTGFTNSLVNVVKGVVRPRKGRWAKGPKGLIVPERDLGDSLFFPDNLHHHHLVFRRKDFMQLFGDRSKAKVEPPWRALFFGSDQFSVEVLKILHGTALSLGPQEGLIKVLDVCTRVGTGSGQNPVVKYARKHGLNIVDYPIPKDKPLEGYDVGLLASFGPLVPTRVIQSFPYGILNVHPSLLPRWRGAAPLNYTILNGDTETGVTIMQVAPLHFDIGPIVMQQRFRMPTDRAMSAQQLRSWLAWEGGMLLIETLERLPKLVHKPIEQRMSGITYAHKLRPEMGHVDWGRSMSSEIRRQFLALDEAVGLTTVVGGLELRLHDLALEDVIEEPRRDSLLLDAAPGSHFFDKRTGLLCIRCYDGWVGFGRVKMKGKPVMTARDFQNGFLSKATFKDQIFQSRPNHIHRELLSARVRRTIASVSRDECLTVTHGHDCLLDGKKGKRFVEFL